MKNPKGVYEKVPGSNIWSARYADAAGRIRREVVGSKSAAINLYRKRKTEVLQGKNLPETLRRRVVLFSEIANDADEYCKANNQGCQFDAYRLGRLKEEFGGSDVLIPIEDLRRWFDQQTWENGTYNRYKSTLSLTYRLAIENGKATSNPARLLKAKREDNGRVRFLNQFEPIKTDPPYLLSHTNEESRLRAVIAPGFRVTCQSWKLPCTAA